MKDPAFASPVDSKRRMHSKQGLTAIYPGLTDLGHHEFWDMHCIQFQPEEFRILSADTEQVTKDDHITATKRQARFGTKQVVDRFIRINSKENKVNHTDGPSEHPRERDTDNWPRLNQEFGDEYAKVMSILHGENILILTKEERDMLSTAGSSLILDSNGRLKEAEDADASASMPQDQFTDCAQPTSKPIHLSNVRETWASHKHKELGPQSGGFAQCKCLSHLELVVPEPYWENLGEGGLARDTLFVDVGLHVSSLNGFFDGAEHCFPISIAASDKVMSKLKQDPDYVAKIRKTMSKAIEETYSQINHHDNKWLKGEEKARRREDFAANLTLAMADSFQDYQLRLKLSSPPSSLQIAAHNGSPPSSSLSSPVQIPATTDSEYGTESKSLVSSPLLSQ